MQARTPALAGALLVAVSCTGCYSTWDIAPRELGRLDGYRATAPVKLRDQEGSVVEFDEESELQLRRGSAVLEEKLVAASANGPLLTAIRRTDQSPLYIDLRRVETARVKRFSTGKTAATVGVVVGVGATATIALVTALLVSRLPNLSWGSF